MTCRPVVDDEDDDEDGKPWHLVPLADERDHVAERDCWCCPTLDDEGTWVHHAADRRDLFGTGDTFH